jgi:hypothetical protein
LIYYKIKDKEIFIMELKNGYKVIYEKIADGTRIFYATKNTKCDPTVDDKIVEAKIGEYKLIYEKAGQFYGSTTGIPAEGDYCFEGFDRVFVKEEAGNEPDAANEEPVAPVAEPEADEPAEDDETPVEVDEPTSGDGESIIEE